MVRFLCFTGPPWWEGPARADFRGAMASSSIEGAASYQRAKELAAAGRFEDAYELLAVEDDPSLPPEARVFKERLRTRMRQELDRRFPTHDLVLRRRTAAADLRSFPLCSREVFLLHLFRDELALRDALALSPLDELDNLRGIAKLMDLGLVDAA